MLKLLIAVLMTITVSLPTYHEKEPNDTPWEASHAGTIPEIVPQQATGSLSGGDVDWWFITVVSPVQNYPLVEAGASVSLRLLNASTERVRMDIWLGWYKIGSTNLGWQRIGSWTGYGNAKTPKFWGLPCSWAPARPRLLIRAVLPDRPHEDLAYVINYGRGGS